VVEEYVRKVGIRVRYMGFAFMLNYFLCMPQVLLEPGLVLEPHCGTQARNPSDSGRLFYDECNLHFNTLFSSVGDWLKAIG
jgi:hypothetical protein